MAVRIAIVERSFWLSSMNLLKDSPLSFIVFMGKLYQIYTEFGICQVVSHLSLLTYSEEGQSGKIKSIKIALWGKAVKLPNPRRPANSFSYILNILNISNMKNLMPQESEFLLYTSPDGEVHVDVLFNDETIWLTQKRMAELFGVEVNTINTTSKKFLKALNYKRIQLFEIFEQLQVTASQQF